MLMLCTEPEKRHPHAAVGRLPLVPGRCISPSCHKWPSRSQSFPERREDSHFTFGFKWHTQNSVWLQCANAASPLCLCIRLCWCHKGETSTRAFPSEFLAAVWTNPSQSPGSGGAEDKLRFLKASHHVEVIFDIKRTFFLFYLELDGAVVCGVECVEQIMCVHACICDTKKINVWGLVF